MDYCDSILLLFIIRDILLLCPIPLHRNFPTKMMKMTALVPRMEMSGFRNPHVLHHNPPSTASDRESSISFYWSCWLTGFPPGMSCPLPVLLATCVITVVASHLTSCGWDRRKFLLITDFPSAVVEEEESNNLVRKQRSFRIVSSVQTVDTFHTVQWPFLPDQES